MNHRKHTLKQNLLAAAVTTALGTTAVVSTATAAELTFSIEGWFTMLNPPGTSALTNGDASAGGFYGFRTPIQGTMTFDTDNGTGSGTVVPFSFFGSGVAAATGISFQAIGDGTGGAGPLVLGNMGFNWGGTNGIPVSLVMDGTGLFNAIGTGIAVGESVGSPLADPADLTCNNDVACSDAATEGFGFNFGKFTYTLPMGPSPVVTTTFNTTDIGAVTVGTNPSGTLPLTDDGIGGSPMKAGPFPLFNANFDITRMVLTSDGSGPAFTAPDPVFDLALGIDETPVIDYPVAIGTVTDEPVGTTVNYSIDGKAVSDPTKTWVADNGINNIIQIDLLETVTNLVVDWRVENGGTSFDTQLVEVTIQDLVAPFITSTPPNVFEVVDSTAEPVCFGAATAGDAIDPDPEVQYAINAEANWQTSDPLDNCSNDFGPNDNTVYWRAVDATGNISEVTQQTVTLDLPQGIIGKACVVDLDVDAFRDVNGRFIMYNPSGALTGDIDNTVTGEINTTLLCDDEVTCNDVGAALRTSQPFFGFLWTAEPVRLYPEGTWTFETCLNDGSSGICNEPDPGDTTISMTVGPGQLGAHMLFDWSVNKAIDVVVVWNVDCNQYMLTTTDPDGDGILGTPMVDGPFRGFNATFDINSDPDETPIADGGFLVSIPVYQNPISGASPIAIDDFEDREDLPSDNNVLSSCVGGCFDFNTDGIQIGSDDAGEYLYTVVAVPLDAQLPFWSQYRKFDEDTGVWGSFRINGRNEVKTAIRDTLTGFCPEPGKGSYVREESGAMAGKLIAGHDCLELTIEDNGPNDSNPLVGIIGDPGGVAEMPAPKLPNADTSNGSCSLSPVPVAPQQRADWWLLLGGLVAWMGVRLRRMRRQGS